MYRLTAKLRLIKHACKSLHRQHTSHISRRVAEAKSCWISAQVALDETPGSVELMSAERNHARIYSQLCKEEEAFYKQRSRIQWLSLGDRNTKFFHRSLVHRQSRNRVHGLTDESVLLRGRSFWYIKLPTISSWSWKKILQSRSWCKGLFTSSIGNGMDTSLWLDYWLPDGKRICDLLPFRVLSSTGLPWNAKVADIIIAGRWSFPSGHQDLQQIWNSIPFHPRTHQLDACIWTGTAAGNFTIDSAWNLLRDTRPRDSKYHLIWFPGHTPRHAFIFWIASMDKLYTMDRLLSFRITTTSSCILCGVQAETHDHLFFNCPFSSTVWRDLAAKTLYCWPNTSWQRLLQWAASIFRKPKDFTHILSRMVLSTTVYYIWYERNNRIFKNAYRSPQELRAEAYEVIRVCIMEKDYGRVPENLKNIWGLPDS
ncbi:hypothetical protein NC653_026594 [Populus alba x Populus x berolinensis]|uniref:Reverse transcriptase zinc-binding domain-containing protein n=1 Tax=Populus alba x Populus x berolinensis TaxID=444605 RepID=A0AAD6Q9F5_9ROSI|nr:hypothetical protein NC653_026594 [Populus alba x Populus x berolinensis]